MLRDADQFAKRYNKCERFSHKTHIPTNKLHYMASAWPFLHWGIDIMGTLLLAPGRRKYSIVAIYYLTEWVEFEAYASIMQTKI